MITRIAHYVRRCEVVKDKQEQWHMLFTIQGVKLDFELGTEEPKPTAVRLVLEYIDANA